MANICKSTDKNIVRKRRSEDPAALDSSPIKKRLRGYYPKTSLLDLNDHYLLTIFENLNEIDICHVQNVCGRFIPLAVSALPTIRKRSPEKIISNLRYTSTELRRVIYKFGEFLDGTSLTVADNLLLIRSSLDHIRDKLGELQFKTDRAKKQIEKAGIMLRKLEIELKKIKNKTSL